jgi:protein involved in polysaccharide export with SLBB domain
MFIFMKKGLSILLLLFASFAIQSILPTQVNGQQMGGISIGNIQDMRVDDLSDAEVLNFYRQMQAQGFTVQEIANIARARGLPATEASKLTSRLNQVSAMQGRIGERDDTRSGRRASEEAELLFDPFAVGEDDLLLSELRRYVQERNEADLMEQLKTILEEGFPIFGANLFAGPSRSFEPSFNIPTPIDYIFGTDDEVRIDIYGAAEAEYNLIVSPDGNIRIPNLGPIRIAGLKYDEARSRIVNNLKRIYSGINVSNPDQANTFVDVSLGAVRSINVHMIGEVKQPGSYTVSSLATVFNMLYAAGGPSRSGTWRSIQVVRGENIVAEFDLYDLIIFANQSDNIRLMDQDIIKVDPYINRVRLKGEVKRAGIFEMKEGETLADLIHFAGGFAEGAYKERIVLHRKSNIQKTISDVRWPEGGDIVIQNGDEIEIRNIVDRYENRVKIEGAVYRDGDFELTENMTLTELIEKAEGVKQDAYLERGIIIRNMDNLMLESIAFSVRDIMSGEAEDILLKRDDLIRINSIFDMQETLSIQVSGAVNKPERMEYLEGMTLEDAIYLADGLRNRAAAYRVEVARRVAEVDTRVKVNQIAEVFQFEIEPDFRFVDRADEFVLKPFDRVFVRTMPNYQRQITVTIEGEVQFPGEYVLETRDARLSDIVRQAGGLSQYAFPQGASMQRILEIVQRDRDGDNENGDGVQRSGPLATLNLENVDLDRFEIVNDTLFTPVGIRLGEALNRPGGISDLRVEEGDVITIPRQFQTVRVEGGVLAPVTMRYVPGRGLQSYVDAAGGTTDRGQRHRAYIVYANGEVDRTRRFLRLRSNPDVEPGATIIIPEKPASRELTPQETISLASSIASTALLFITLIDRVRD